MPTTSSSRGLSRQDVDLVVAWAEQAFPVQASTGLREILGRGMGLARVPHLQSRQMAFVAVPVYPSSAGPFWLHYCRLVKGMILLSRSEVNKALASASWTVNLPHGDVLEVNQEHILYYSPAAQDGARNLSMYVSVHSGDIDTWIADARAKLR